MKVRIAILLLCLTLIGCQEGLAPKDEIHIVGPGWVRSVWSSCYGTWCVYDIIFEHESGRLQTYHLKEFPPVWKGIYCKLTIRKSGKYKNHYVIISVERLGNDDK